MKNSKGGHNKKLIVGIIAILAIILLVSAFFIYTGKCYEAQDSAIEVINNPASVQIIALENDIIVFKPEKAVAGIVFYPGAKVDYRSYAPLMKACAERDILCILVKMPFNMAFFDKDAGAEVKDMYPEIDNWYMAGHSLGGVVAAQYSNENKTDIKGVILLGSYSSTNLKGTGIKTLLIYGSEDKVINIKNYEKCKGNLDSDYVEKVIQGGCHSYFGSYGIQDGDGTPTISNEEQISITADTIADFIK